MTDRSRPHTQYLQPNKSAGLILTYEAIALVFPCRGLPCQHTGLDSPKGLEDALYVVIRQVRVHGRYVDSVKGAGFLG